MPYVYILLCNDDSTYVGSTWNLERRLAEHNAGLGAAYTASRLPVQLLYFEETSRIEAAYRREKQIQGWSRAKRFALINGDVDALRRASRKRPSTAASGKSTQPGDPDSQL